MSWFKPVVMEFGKVIIRIITHKTVPVQNKEFRDKYFHELSVESEISYYDKALIYIDVMIKESKNRHKCKYDLSRNEIKNIKKCQKQTRKKLFGIGRHCQSLCYLDLFRYKINKDYKKDKNIV